MSAHDSIVILGAGIIGLDVALVLAERGYGKSITVIAEHLPGDTALTYTSPWAGCNFSAISGTDANALKWDKAGYFHLSKLASERPEQSYVKRTPSTELWDDNVPSDKIQAMSEYSDRNGLKGERKCTIHVMSPDGLLSLWSFRGSTGDDVETGSVGASDGVGVLKDNGVELVAREDGEVGTGDSICDTSIP
ncbi:hypothetical protein HZ326_20701 [Fusarium oxysporum f. sp. albedinis]|nr:hypothetical protein HZ326_20701 [Fusarium oxysporum f. sp. albedinis]